MTNLREAAQMALDALFNLRWAASERDKKNRIRQFDDFMDASDEAIEALRAALAQPEIPNNLPVANLKQDELMYPAQPELVATGFIRTIVEIGEDGIETWKNEPFYTAPLQRECAGTVHDRREWQGLTDEEIKNAEIVLRNNGDYCELHFARAIEFLLKEKNGV